MRMAVVGRRSFSLNDKAVDARAFIVGEWPIAALRLGRGVSAAVHQGPSSLRRIRPGSPAGRPATNVDLRLKAAGDGPDERAYRAGVVQAYALLASFGAGVSRA